MNKIVAEVFRTYGYAYSAVTALQYDIPTQCDYLQVHQRPRCLHIRPDPTRARVHIDQKETSHEHNRPPTTPGPRSTSPFADTAVLSFEIVPSGSLVPWGLRRVCGRVWNVSIYSLLVVFRACGLVSLVYARWQGFNYSVPLNLSTVPRQNETNLFIVVCSNFESGIRCTCQAIEARPHDLAESLHRSTLGNIDKEGRCVRPYSFPRNDGTGGSQEWHSRMGRAGGLVSDLYPRCVVGIGELASL